MYKVDDKGGLEHPSGYATGLLTMWNRVSHHPRQQVRIFSRDNISGTQQGQTSGSGEVLVGVKVKKKVEITISWCQKPSIGQIVSLNLMWLRHNYGV